MRPWGTLVLPSYSRNTLKLTATGTVYDSFERKKPSAETTVSNPIGFLHRNASILLTTACQVLVFIHGVTCICTLNHPSVFLNIRNWSHRRSVCFSPVPLWDHYSPAALEGIEMLCKILFLSCSHIWLHEEHYQDITEQQNSSNVVVRKKGVTHTTCLMQWTLCLRCLFISRFFPVYEYWPTHIAIGRKFSCVL